MPGTYVSGGGGIFSDKNFLMSKANVCHVFTSIHCYIMFPAQKSAKDTLFAYKSRSEYSIVFENYYAAHNV